MKKLVAGSLAVICLFLCACGSYRTDDGTAPETMTPLESMPPVESMMPDPEDGIVEDDDGVIEENEGTSHRTPAPGSTERP